MTLAWKSEDHDYPFRAWKQAEIALKMQAQLPDGSTATIDSADAKLILWVGEIRAAKGPGYIWCAHATLEENVIDGSVQSVCIWKGERYSNEIEARSACVNSAKLALLNLLGELG
jgi:hypothetical protein